MSDVSDLNVIDPAAHCAVDLGEGAGAFRVVVRPLKLKQLPAFAAAVTPIAEDVARIFGEGATPSALLSLISERMGHVIEALSCATGAPRELIEDASIEQCGELLLAVINANRDFLRGRLITALKSAATNLRGDGPTPSNP